MDSPAIRNIFHVTIEQSDCPELRGKLLAVGHGARRSEVAAAGYEARA